MARRLKKAPTDHATAAAKRSALATLGLAYHQQIRFRRDAGARWHTGTALRREDDGSLGLIDERGRQRSIPIADVEVAMSGPRGGRIWVPLPRVADAGEQLGLF